MRRNPLHRDPIHSNWSRFIQARMSPRLHEGVSNVILLYSDEVIPIRCFSKHSLREHCHISLKTANGKRNRKHYTPLCNYLINIDGYYNAGEVASIVYKKWYSFYYSITIKSFRNTFCAAASFITRRRCFFPSSKTLIKYHAYETRTSSSETACRARISRLFLPIQHPSCCSTLAVGALFFLLSQRFKSKKNKEENA